MSHIADGDLVNFARDQLGERKKDKILAHCKQCDWCAERLIDATREHAPDPAPFKLTRFQKISIAVMIIALIASVAGMVWFFRQLGQQASPFDMPPGYEQPIPEPEQQSDQGVGPREPQRAPGEEP